MKRVFHDGAFKNLGERLELDSEESKHLLSVLRLESGEKVEVLNGSGRGALASLLVERKRAALVLEKWIEDPGRASTLPITLEQCCLKGDAMDWVIEKAAELGVERLVPIVSDHTVVQVDRKGPEAFQERWQKIADQSLKQCGRLTRMAVELPRSLESQLSLSLKSGSVRLWASEQDRAHATSLSSWLESRTPSREERIHLLIGPEGGWSAAEIAQIAPVATPISLGPWVLRAETAALYAVSGLSHYFRSRHLDTRRSL